MDRAANINGYQKSVKPENIIKTGMGFWASKTLLAAIKQGLFTMLKDNQMPGRKIQEELNLHFRSLYDFLDALVALGFIKREGLMDNAVYRNSADAALYLDKSKETYIDGFFEMANDRLYPFLGNLEDGLRTGQPQNELKETGEYFFKELYREPARLKQFLQAMAGFQMGNFKTLLEKFDHLNCITVDLQPVEPIARDMVQKFGLEDRVTVRSVDFFKDEIPVSDVIIMGNILHDWNLEEKKILIRKAYDQLTDDGALIVIENIIDNDRSANLFGLLMSLNMLIEAPGGFDFTGIDFEKWTREIGFKSTEVVPLTGPASASIAYK